jgi:hypothetical protein
MENCLFCNQPLENIQRWKNRDAYSHSCHNCGEYLLSGTFKESLQISSDDKIRIASYLQSRHLTGKSPVALTDEKLSQGDIDGVPLITIDEMLDQFPKRVDEKINRALLNMGKLTKHFGQIIGITSEYYPLFYAINSQELITIIHELEQSGYLRRAEFKSTGSSYIAEISVTAKGFDRIYELGKVNPTSHQAFVAMWFDSSLDNIYEKGVKRAIEDAGYDSKRIDKKEFLGKIDDEIIAEIRRSRFLVADFTGFRTGVFYEAGFAYGLGIPVIFTCKEDYKDKIKEHFDTRQYKHITWKDENDLYTQLLNTIGASSSIGWGSQVKKEKSK